IVRARSTGTCRIGIGKITTRRRKITARRGRAGCRLRDGADAANEIIETEVAGARGSDRVAALPRGWTDGWTGARTAAGKEDASAGGRVTDGLGGWSDCAAGESRQRRRRVTSR